MKLIAISQRTDTIQKYRETRDALDHNWYPLLHACGLIPVICPNDTILTQNLINQLKPSGILLTGGNNSYERDKTERLLLEYAISHQLPLLGICHGMQVIQQYFGIQLVEVSGHITSLQTITINGDPCNVNSYHTLGTQENAPELISWAYAADNTIKAIKHRTLPIVGIMWHPERRKPYAIRDIHFIKQFYAGAHTCELLY